MSTTLTVLSYILVFVVGLVAGDAIAYRRMWKDFKDNT